MRKTRRTGCVRIGERGFRRRRSIGGMRMSFKRTRVFKLKVERSEIRVGKVDFDVV